MFSKSLLVLVCATAFDPGGQDPVQGAGPPKDLSAQVRSIFLAKCSECHGRSLSRPRAGLYLHELGQVASHRDWVVPFEPEQSYLWILVRDGDMPAKGAKAGPLSSEEKETVRAWISAGAPVPRSSVMASRDDSLQGSADSTAPASSPVIESPVARGLAWLGRFHIVVIHFPIALLITVALIEMTAACRGSRAVESGIRLAVLVATLSAIAAVALGWLHADLGGNGSASSPLLSLHRWLGTAAAVWSIAIAVLSELDSRRGHRSLLFRFFLWTGALLVAMTAHFGGLLVHGSRFFG
jgi:mono/diheme cytochrome c family protein/uncharacterized membrane protein